MLKTKELLYGTALLIDKGYWITHYVKGTTSKDLELVLGYPTLSEGWIPDLL